MSLTCLDAVLREVTERHQGSQWSEWQHDPNSRRSQHRNWRRVTGRKRKNEIQHASDATERLLGGEHEQACRVRSTQAFWHSSKTGDRQVSLQADRLWLILCLYIQPLHAVTSYGARDGEGGQARDEFAPTSLRWPQLGWNLLLSATAGSAWTHATVSVEDNFFYMYACILACQEWFELCMATGSGSGKGSVHSLFWSLRNCDINWHYKVPVNHLTYRKFL